MSHKINLIHYIEQNECFPVSLNNHTYVLDTAKEKDRKIAPKKDIYEYL